MGKILVFFWVKKIFFKKFYLFEKEVKRVNKKLNFKVGDIVICINNQDSDKDKIKYGNKYKIVKFYSGNLRSFKKYCDIEDIENNKIYKGYYCDRFMSILDFEALKYNL